MKLRQIIESGYEGLEDDDQFEHPGMTPDGCDKCGLVWPQHPEDIQILNQLVGTPEVTQLPSGWWSTPEAPDELNYRKMYCPDCYEEGWGDPRYAYLDGPPSSHPHPSELDQYIRDRDWSEIESYPGESEESIEQARQQRNKALGLGDDNKLLESYEGLEDADEFGDDEFIIWVGGGRWGQYMEHGRYSDVNAAIRTAEILSGPVTVTRGYGETVWENDVDPMVIESSYEGLEDSDTFSDETHCHNCLGDAGEIARTGDQSHECQGCGTVYCSSCIPGGGIYNRSKAAGRQVHHVYEVQDGKVGPRVRGRYGNKVPFKEKDFEVSPQGIIFSCPGCEAPDLFPWEEPIEESYEGLEDADEFQDEYAESVFCIGHGWMPYDAPTTSWCRRCGSTWCHNCVEKAPDPNWKPDYENSSFMNTPAEYIPGNFDNMDDASLAARTDPNAFVSETHLPTGEDVQVWMQCPVCLASRGPIESLQIKEGYEGLEDADQFDSGENLEEAEQIMMWMNNNGIYVKQDGDVVDIYDKHGVLEGFPDGRRFGDDIPVDRVVLQSPNGSWLEWLVLHINHAYALIWLLDETLDRVDQQQWYTARTEQLEGGI